MNMTKTVAKFVEESNAIKTKIMEKFMPDVLENMDGEDFELLRDLFKFMNTSIDLVVCQSEVIDEMNGKLDKLLAK